MALEFWVCRVMSAAVKAANVDAVTSKRFIRFLVND